ncbi:Stage V sporulation protein D [bacterium HR08]|nr:Stage V sporulation protein D [bacterium HR08]
MRRFKRAWFIGLVFVLLDPTWPLSHIAPSASGDEDAAYASAIRFERQASRRSRASARQRARRRAARRAAAARRLARLEASVRRASQVAIQRDDLRGEDPEVRQAVLAALRHHAGTVVVMDPYSGRIYSIVNQEWALRKGFKPCSTIKLLVGLAGLKEGIIDAKTPLPLGGGSIAMNLIEALAHSNNQYFQIIGERLGRTTLLRYAREWGLGQPTEINLPRESAGRLPSERPPRPRRRRSAPPPAVGRMASHGDGFAVTALQLAVLTSAIINGGTLYRPQIVRSEAEASRLIPIPRRHLDLPPEHRENLIAGMIAAVEYGTAKLAYVPGITFAGKTGSCRGDSLWLGLFTSFAPVSDPRLVVTVIVQGRHERGSTAASIASQIYQRLAHRLIPLPTAEPSPERTPERQSLTPEWPEYMPPVSDGAKISKRGSRETPQREDGRIARPQFENLTKREETHESRSIPRTRRG